MKIQVVIEAESIKEYTEAIQALAAGYTVEMSQPSASAVASLKADEIKVAEEKPKRTRRAVFKEDIKKDTSKPAETPKEEKNTPAPKTEEKTDTKETEAPKQESTVSFVDVKLKAKQLSNLPDGKADVKFILDKLNAKKLSDLSEDQYTTFMEMAEESMSKPTSSPESEKPVQDKSEKEDKATHDDEEITLAMIRSKAKELSVAGLGDEIRDTLKGFNAKSLTGLKKDQYADFYKALGEING